MYNTSLPLNRGEYYEECFKKDLIVLHHTVGGSAKSTIDYWNSDPKRIGVAFVVERDGTIFQCFDPKYWACHLGVVGDGNKMDRRSIGIEIASEGGLTEHNGALYSYGVVSNRTLFTQASYDNQSSWRGFRYFDAYNPKQIDAVVELINNLSSQFNIPKTLPDKGLFEFNAKHYNHVGIIGHANVRADKSDIHPGFPVERLK